MFRWVDFSGHLARCWSFGQVAVLGRNKFQSIKSNVVGYKKRDLTEGFMKKKKKN